MIKKNFAVLFLFTSIGAFYFGWYFDGFHSGDYSPYANSSTILSIPIMLVAVMIFFAKDEIFYKWLKYAEIWAIVTVIFLVQASDGGGWVSLGIEKNQVALLMGIVLLIFSSRIFFSRKSRKK